MIQLKIWKEQEGSLGEYATSLQTDLRNEVEITEVIQWMINNREEVYPVFFKGKYINITYPEDLRKAEEILQCGQKHFGISGLHMLPFILAG